MKITVLHSPSSKASFCKIFQSVDGKLTPDKQRLHTRFKCEQREVGNLEELSALLLDLESDASRFIIRGQPIEGVDISKPVIRKTASALVVAQDAPFADQPIHWLMLDIDKQTLPASIDLLSKPLDAVEYLIQQLPKEFHNCSVHYQLSGSAGVLYTDRISAHLVFWLDRPTTSKELREWAKAINKTKRLIDQALFNPVQPHYTSRPKFPSDFVDPFEGRRSGLIKKEHSTVSIDYNVNLKRSMSHVPMVNARLNKSVATKTSSLS